MRIAILARWTARLAATAVCGLFIAFLVGEGTPDLRELSDAELAGFGALALMFVGTLIAWRKDLVGALVLLVGFGLFAFIEHGWPPVPFLIYPAAALLLLLSALLRFIARRRAGAAPSSAAGIPA